MHSHWNIGVGLFLFLKKKGLSAQATKAKDLFRGQGPEQPLGDPLGKGPHGTKQTDEPGAPRGPRKCIDHTMCKNPSSPLFREENRGDQEPISRKIVCSQGQRPLFFHVKIPHSGNERSKDYKKQESRERLRAADPAAGYKLTVHRGRRAAAALRGINGTAHDIDEVN
jgi:hypothetical protein